MQIETTGLRRAFGPVLALRGVDLAIPSGRRVGLVGPNGSGKSTLIRIVMGLLEFEGQVRIDGRDPRADRLLLAPRLAYVPQVAPGFAAPAGDLIGAVCGLRGLDPGALDLPTRELGLDWRSIARTPFRNLSGGMKQKLLIALALVTRAELLVLDEPTASLDAVSRDRCLRLLGDLAPSTTLILCSHRLEEMRSLIDHVVALEDGSVRFQGLAADFLARRSLSVITAQAKNGSGAWLRERGFSEGRSGRFEKTVTHAEKVSLLPVLSDRLADAAHGLLDLDVRDVDAVAAADEEVPQ